MSRNKDELLHLLSKTKENYIKEFGVEFPNVRIEHLIQDELGRRQEKFVERYLGHLQQTDLLNFLEVLRLDNFPPPIKQSAPITVKNATQEKPKQK